MMDSTNANSLDDFNPILDEPDDDPFAEFDEVQEEHNDYVASRHEEREAAKKARVEEDLTFDGFKSQLPEPQETPKAVHDNSVVSRDFKAEARERSKQGSAKRKEYRKALDSEAAKRKTPAPKTELDKVRGERKSQDVPRPSHVDEELEKSKPFVETLKPRERSTANTSSRNSVHVTKSSETVDGPASTDAENVDSSSHENAENVDGANRELTPGEKWSGNVKQKRYRYAGDNGLLNGAELEFFKSNETSRRAVMLGDDSLDYLRPPVGVTEGNEEREKRVERVTEAVFGRDALRRNSKKKWSRKHQEMLEFLAKFKYATPRHLSKMFSESVWTTVKRLKALRTYGLVIDKKILGGEPLWFLTDAGMLLSGYDMPKVTDSRITFTMLPHQYAVNHLAANLWGAGINVLNEEEYPHKNRVDLLGKQQYGDNVVSEQEIQSSFGKLKLFSKADAYLPTLKASMDREWKQWEQAGGVDFGPSPEFQPGNEYMWAVYPPAVVKLAYHVPDLVVARPRNADGEAQSIAVELEIQNKAVESYRKTLTAYRYSSQVYKQVVWVCQKPAAAKKIRELANEMGMLESGALRIVPIITQDGIFKGSDLWTL